MRNRCFFTRTKRDWKYHITCNTLSNLLMPVSRFSAIGTTVQKIPVEALALTDPCELRRYHANELALGLRRSNQSSIWYT
jgi:hypothetical protein